MPFRSVVTVTTPAAFPDLTDLLNVLADLELNATTSAQKVNLRKQIRQCSKAIESYCNRTFAVQTYTENFYPDYDSRFDNVLMLSQCPIITVTSITEDGVALVNGTDFIIDSGSGCVNRVYNGIPFAWFLGGFPWGSLETKVVTAVYQAGYGVIPEDLQDAVHRMIRGRRFAQGRDPMLRQENIPGVAEYQYWIASAGESGNFTPDVEEIISKYRMPLAA